MSSSKNRSKHYFRRKRMQLRGYDYSKGGLYFVTIDCKNMECRFGNIIKGQMILSDWGKVAFDEWLKLPFRFQNFKLDTFQIMPNHMHAIVSLINQNDIEGHVVGKLLDFDESEDLLNDREPGDLLNYNEPGDPSINSDPGDFKVYRESGASPDTAKTEISKLKGNELSGLAPDSVLNSIAPVSVSNTIPLGSVFNPIPPASDINPMHPVVSNATSSDCKNLIEIIGSYKSIVANKCLAIHKQKFIEVARVPLLGKIWQRSFYDIIIREQQVYKAISRYIRNNPENWARHNRK